MKDMLSNYNEFKTKRLRSLLKQITLLNSNMTFEESSRDPQFVSIRYTVPKELQEKEWPKEWSLHSYAVLQYYAKKPRDRYIGLFKKMFNEIDRSPFDTDTELKFTCLEEYILKLNIRGGK